MRSCLIPSLDVDVLLTQMAVILGSFLSADKLPGQ
jgi:hypothetical protein